MSKKFLAICLIVTFFTIFSNSVFAEDLCVPIKSVVYYGNGVGKGVSTYSDAVKSSALLELGYNQHLGDPSLAADYTFKLAFNQSAGRLGDIIEAAKQTFGDNWPTILAGFLLGNDLILRLLPDSVVQNFNDFLTNQAIQELVTPSATSEDVNNHVSSYKSDIGEGKKVILVAHSQGNIFANWSYQRLSASESQYFTIVPVASPESIVRKSLVGHVRFSDDLVILGVQAAKAIAGIPTPLPSNDSDEVDADFLSHGFKEAYLKDSSARSFILYGIETSESLLPDPPMSSGQGTITVTLTWGSNPDLDLHTFEPTGRHVYYASRTGNFGYLDVDDVSSWGPEHYYASCEKISSSPLAIGRYQFGVNYYRGYSPETAKVTIKTPGAEQTITKTLPYSRGSGGNSSPVMFGDVIVSKNPTTGRFDFAIEAR